MGMSALCCGTELVPLSSYTCALLNCTECVTALDRQFDTMVRP